MRAIVRALSMIATSYKTIQAKKESLERRKSYLLTIQAISYGDKVKSSNYDDIADRIASTVDEEKELINYLNKLAVLEKSIFTHMDELPPETAYIVQQYYLEGKLTPEIARELKLSRPNISTKLNRGINYLADACVEELRKAGLKDD